MTLTFPFTLCCHLNFKLSEMIFLIRIAAVGALLYLLTNSCYTFFLHPILASSSDDLKWKACQTWKLHFKLTEDFTLSSRHVWRFFYYSPSSTLLQFFTSLPRQSNRNLLISSFRRVRHVRWVKRIKVK